MRAYRDRLSFRVLSLLLKLDVRWATLIVGILYLPFLWADFTIAVIAFILALFAILWLSSVPCWKQTDDGTWYWMESDERAEWVFENKRFPKL